MYNPESLLFERRMTLCGFQRLGENELKCSRKAKKKKKKMNGIIRAGDRQTRKAVF